MREVVAKLNECLATELARTKNGHESQDLNEITNMNLTIQLSPLAR